MTAHQGLPNTTAMPAAPDAGAHIELTGRHGAVAAGDPATAAAAAGVLAAGGSAVDAAVAAGLAACVAEPGLASLGGGGFLLRRAADGSASLLDFFVDSPGRGLPPGEARMREVEVHFPTATQVFHVGHGSAAVPGVLDGLLTAHAEHGRLPLAQVTAPAIELAEQGTPMSSTQAAVLRLLADIVSAEFSGREWLAPTGRVLAAGELARNPLLAGVLRRVGGGTVSSLSDPDLAAPLLAAQQEGGGRITAQDLLDYRVVRREPFRVRLTGGTLLTNASPAFGGRLVAAGLAALHGEHSDAALARVLVKLPDHRESELEFGEEFAADPVTAISPLRAAAGTTHISVIDSEGTAVAMTISNGSCSGAFIPGTGIQLNNMMGEADLHPHSGPMPVGVRIGSMMAPSILVGDDGTVTVLGSGGSERIRSALICVAARVLAGHSLSEAVLAPRVHWNGTTLDKEPRTGPLDPGDAQFPAIPVREWAAPNLYFGGVHCVQQGPFGTTAIGDPRRDGAAIVLPPHDVRSVLADRSSHRVISAVNVDDLASNTAPEVTQ